MLEVKPDLVVREAKACDTAAGVRLVAQPVPRLLRGRPVVAQPVRLDYEPEPGPEEVHREPADVPAGLRQREPGTAYEPQEAPLELGVRERADPAGFPPP